MYWNIPRQRGNVPLSDVILRIRANLTRILRAIRGRQMIVADASAFIQHLRNFDTRASIQPSEVLVFLHALSFLYDKVKQ